MTERERPIIKKGEPLRLPDGTIIHPNKEGAERIEPIEVQNEKLKLGYALEDPFSTISEKFARTLADVPAPVSQMNPTMLVLAYSMWGLDTHAIARLLERTYDEIALVEQSPLFMEMRKQVVEALRYAETGSVHAYIAQQSINAAQTIINKLSSKSEDVQMAAAKDILDRSGFRPADRTEHVHKFEDELRIVHMQETTAPKIDIDF